jgi:hypothetical protein
MPFVFKRHFYYYYANNVTLANGRRGMLRVTSAIV